MVLVIGSVVIKPGLLAQALALSREQVARSRTEPGCLAHAVHQDAEDPQRLVFVEEWSDRAALKTHFAQPGSRAFGAALIPLAALPPSLKIYEAQQIK